MKYYLDDEEVTLERLEDVRKNLFVGGLELLKIEPDALYFTITLYWG